MIGKAAIGKWAVGKAPVAASSGGDLNITASLGTASATSYAATVDRQRTIAASLGTATALGYQVSISGTDPLHGFTQDKLDFLVTYMRENLTMLSEIVEGTDTMRDVLRMVNAVLGGKVSGAGTGTETFRNPADTKDRLVVTVDSSGNRTAIARDLD